MWRSRAVIAMLVDDIAGLGPIGPETEEIDGLLASAVRRAKLVVAVDCLDILILFLFREQTRPFLPVNQTIETVFTLGVLAVAAHAGFRWAQVERLRAVKRLCAELLERAES